MFRFILLIFSCSLFATEILLPQNRAHFLTNEMIYVSVVRQAKVLSANKLIVNLAGPHKSHMKLSFHIPASKNQFRTEHIQLNAALMRPGKYQLKITADGNSTLKSFSVISHYNKSSFRTINWGGKAKDKQQLSQGEENLGYNLFIGHGPKDDNAYLLQASVDFMSCCSMSGGHQMDLRPECDWSDPQVFQGGTMRVVRRAIMDRIRPNVTGIHFYDEAKLSDGIGGGNAHNIPSQLWAWEATYNKSRVAYKDRTKYPEQWREWSLWKLGFMDAAWKDAKFGIDLVKPELLSITDSQFAYNDLSHGYYYNVNDSLPVLLGHGGFHDEGPGYFNPSMTLELARAKNTHKENWFLPTWHADTSADQLRLEQYLAFQLNIQGLATPPALDPLHAAKGNTGQTVIEVNKLCQRLGPIFKHIPANKPPITMLYSLSQRIHLQTHPEKKNAHVENLKFTYLAGKLLQYQFMPILDEDIINGSLQNHHKAVIIGSINYLSEDVINALVDFIKAGNYVYTTSDCKVKIAGAIDIGVVPRLSNHYKIKKLIKDGKGEEASKYQTLTEQLKAAKVLADALKTQFDKAKIKPILFSSSRGISATKYSDGDISYYFAVNASHDPNKGDLGLKL